MCVLGEKKGAVSFVSGRPSNFYLACSAIRLLLQVPAFAFHHSFIQLGLSALITVVTVAATVGKQFTGRKTAKAHRRGAGSREAAQRESVEQRNSGARLHQEKLSDMKKEYICTCYYSAFQVIKMRPPAGVDYICSASKKKKMCITMTTFNKPTPLLPFSFCGDPPTSTLVPPLHEQTEWVCQL